jgi:SAM-dependent methyltransferase
MSIAADAERAFYDTQYAQFLTLPDSALKCDRTAMLAIFNDPTATQFERRRLYLRALAYLTSQPLEDLAVLDYGCGPGEWGVFMATEGADATLLDISPVAVELGMRRARANGVAGRVRGIARDASDLSCFRDGEFDLVFANAALHHTLKYPNALEELARVIRPGSRLVLAETYGNNPLLNAARRFRACIQRDDEDQGEEILMSDTEIARLRQYFDAIEVDALSLLSMGKRLFRGRFDKPLVRTMLGVLEAVDARLLKAPALGRYCGEVVICAHRSS